MQNTPLRNPFGAANTAPQEGALYVTATGIWRKYTSGVWQDVAVGDVTRLASRSVTLTGGATGSTTTDWSSNPAIATDVSAGGHAMEDIPMAALSTTDNANSIPQNTWTCIGFNQNHCNDNGMWDGGGTVYLNQSGFYLVSATVRWYWDTDSGRRLSELRCNGGYRFARGFGATSSGEHARGMTVFTHSGGSGNVQLWVYNESSGSNRPVFEATLIVWKISVY